jgi:hypothetical protein
MIKNRTKILSKTIEDNDLEVLQYLLKKYQKYVDLGSLLYNCIEYKSKDCLYYLIDLIKNINDGFYTFLLHEKNIPIGVMKHIKSYIGKITWHNDNILQQFVDDNEQLLLDLIKLYGCNNFRNLYIVKDIISVEGIFDYYDKSFEEYIMEKNYLETYKYFLYTQRNNIRPGYSRISEMGDDEVIVDLCDNNHTEMLKIFVNYMNKYSKNNILYETFLNSDYKTTKMLLDCNADPNRIIIDDNKKYTPLEFIKMEIEQSKNDPPSTHKCFTPEWDQILSLFIDK